MRVTISCAWAALICFSGSEPILGKTSFSSSSSRCR
jgi:hypothetical protein